MMKKVISMLFCVLLIAGICSAQEKPLRITFVTPLVAHPVWDVASRRRLGALAATPVPIEAAMVPPLGGVEVAVQREPIFDLAVVPADRVAYRLTRPADRLLFLRALDALRGLAAKHAGSVRGVRHSVELAVLGRRVAVLRADDEVFLDILTPSAASFR